MTTVRVGNGQLIRFVCNPFFLLFITPLIYQIIRSIRSMIDPPTYIHHSINPLKLTIDFSLFLVLITFFFGINSTAYCEGRDTLKNLCDLIPGDAQQYSLFRRDAAPVECPFRGSYTFTYSRGHGECRSPVSRLDSCTESWRTFFRYQACPDVQGTESSGTTRHYFHLTTLRARHVSVFSRSFSTFSFSGFK